MPFFPPFSAIEVSFFYHLCSLGTSRKVSLLSLDQSKLERLLS